MNFEKIIAGVMAAIVVAVAATALFICPADATWYSGSYDYKKSVTIESDYVETTETSFPVLISVTDANLKSTGNGGHVAQADGYDIIFVDTNNITLLDFEIESWDSSTGELQAWVEVSISATVDKTIYMYYGNASATDVSNAVGVWDANYVMVQHLQETPPPYLGAATQSAMDGGDGAWAVFYGSNPISDNLGLAADEDMIGDTERAHTTEQVSFWAFASAASFDIKNSTGTIIGEAGKATSIGTTFTTVNLRNTYTDPVVVTTPNLAIYTDNPAVTRIQNAGATSFQVKLQNPGDLASPTAADVYYIVIEAGDHTLPGDVDMEAGTVTSDGTNEDGDWSSTPMEQITPANSYTTPVVLGQVMTTNDASWSVLWTSNGTQSEPPSPSAIYIGKHVGADTDTTRDNETLGYIILEDSTGTTNGVDWIADLGADTVEGVGSSAPYTYSLNFSNVQDSTSNSNDGATSGMDSADQVAGQIDGSLDFDGTTEYVTVEDDDLFDWGQNDSFTITLWAQLTNCDTRNKVMIGRDENPGGAHWWMGGDIEDKKPVLVLYDTTGDSSVVRGTTSINNGEWHQIIGVRDGSAGLTRLYVNGVEEDETAHSFVAGFDASTTLGIGYMAYAGTPDYWYDGKLDEVRISNVARTAGWIETEYNNQNSPSTFTVFGSEETPLSNWEHRKSVTIDHTKVIGTQTNFPVLISITDTDLKDHAQADGDDILFTMDSVNWSTDYNSDRLDHEIESYDSATGCLTAWVRIPSLSGDANTTIKMYYGNASATDQATTTGVWDDNFVMVQHLQEDPSGGAPQMIDSTSNDNDGTSYGTMTSGNQVAGKIDGNLDFDGVDDSISNTVSGISNSVTTVSGWIYPHTQGEDNEGRIIMLKPTSGWHAIFIDATGTNRLRVGISDGTNNIARIGTDNDITLNVWNHFAYSYDGSAGGTGIKIYINGTEITYSSTTGTNAVSAAPANFFIGSNDAIGSYAYDGLIDEIKVSNTARTAGWIETEYANQNAPGTFLDFGNEETENDAIFFGMNF